jgi:hypothetical protein
VRSQQLSQGRPRCERPFRRNEMKNMQLRSELGGICLILAGLAACNRSEPTKLQSKASGPEKPLPSLPEAPLEKSGREQTVPPSCDVMAAVDLSSPAGRKVTSKFRDGLSVLGSAGLWDGLRYGGLDMERDVRKIALCRRSGVGLREQETGVAIAGVFPRDFMGKVALAKNTLKSTVVSGFPALSHERLWLAWRGSEELVFSTSESLLSDFLSGPVDANPHEHKAALALTFANPALQTALAGTSAVRAPELAALERVSIELSADGSALMAVGVARDAAAANKLTTAVKGLIKEWRTGREKREHPEVSVMEEGPRVVVSAQFPSGGLDSMLGELFSPRNVRSSPRAER